MEAGNHQSVGQPDDAADPQSSQEFPTPVLDSNGDNEDSTNDSPLRSLYNYGNADSFEPLDFETVSRILQECGTSTANNVGNSSATVNSYAEDTAPLDSPAAPATQEEDPPLLETFNSNSQNSQNDSSAALMPQIAVSSNPSVIKIDDSSITSTNSRSRLDYKYKPPSPPALPPVTSVNALQGVKRSLADCFNDDVPQSTYGDPNSSLRSNQNYGVPNWYVVPPWDSDNYHVFQVHKGLSPQSNPQSSVAASKKLNTGESRKSCWSPAGNATTGIARQPSMPSVKPTIYSTTRTPGFNFFLPAPFVRNTPNVVPYRSLFRRQTPALLSGPIRYPSVPSSWTPMPPLNNTSASHPCYCPDCKSQPEPVFSSNHNTFPSLTPSSEMVKSVSSATLHAAEGLLKISETTNPSAAMSGDSGNKSHWPPSVASWVDEAANNVTVRAASPSSCSCCSCGCESATVAGSSQQVYQQHNEPATSAISYKEQTSMHPAATPQATDTNSSTFYQPNYQSSAMRPSTVIDPSTTASSPSPQYVSMEETQRYVHAPRIYPASYYQQPKYFDLMSLEIGNFFFHNSPNDRYSSRVVIVSAKKRLIYEFSLLDSHKNPVSFAVMVPFKSINGLNVDHQKKNIYILVNNAPLLFSSFGQGNEISYQITSSIDPSNGEFHKNRLHRLQLKGNQHDRFTSCLVDFDPKMRNLLLTKFSTDKDLHREMKGLPEADDA